MLAGALHGEFVIADGSTELLQTGKITQVSASSLAVLSTDGYAKTYTIDAATVIGNGQASNLKTGDQVTVIAKSEGTAVAVEDRSAMGQGNLGVPQQPPPGR